MSAEIEYTMTSEKGTLNERTRVFKASRHFGLWWSRYGVYRDAHDLIAKWEKVAGVEPENSFLRDEPLTEGYANVNLADGSQVNFGLAGMDLDGIIDVVEGAADGRTDD